MTTQQPFPKTRPAFPIGPLIGAFAVIDFITPPILKEAESEALAGLLLGIVAAQLGLSAIWAVLGTQRWSVRLCVPLLVIMGLYGALLLGMISTEPNRYVVRDMSTTGLFVPLVFLAVQLPLWILRIALGCRIVPADGDRCTSALGSRQFQMQHMLAATVVLAIALGLASLALHPSVAPYREPGAWMVVLIVCLCCAIASAFSTFPCLWAALVAKDKAASTGAIAAYATFMSFVVVAVISVFGGSGPPGETVIVSLFFHAALAAVMLGTLHLVRLWGYVLVRAGRIETIGSAADSSIGTGRTDPREE